MGTEGVKPHGCSDLPGKEYVLLVPRLEENPYLFDPECPPNEFGVSGNPGLDSKVGVDQERQGTLKGEGGWDNESTMIDGPVSKFYFPPEIPG